MSCSPASAHVRNPDLSAAVDVYSDWIDACDAVAKDRGGLDEGGRAYDGVGATSQHDVEADPDILDDEDEDLEGDYEV